MLSRSNPADRSCSNRMRSTVSGFASVVISASSTTAKRSRRCVSRDFRSAGSIVVGVPPPRNTLATSTPCHAGAASDASASSARRYRGCSRSRPAYALKSQ
jgi:hypothetical protein